MKNLVIVNYAEHLGTVELDADWHATKAYAQNNPHDFIVCGTVVMVDGITISIGSRCSDRYVYYVHIANTVVGPIKHINTVHMLVKDIPKYEVLRGYEFYLDDEAVAPTTID